MGVFKSAVAASKPLPLKQRTSSKDARRDYSHSTWMSLLVLLKIREYFVTVDNFSLWRRHLAWSMENGKDLRSFMTQRYASNMVFMSLLLSTELGILFNSAGVTTNVRLHLSQGHHNTVSFWAGMMIILSALLTLLSLISTFTAWTMVNSVDEANAHCIFRSSIGQYAAELPGRLIVCSIYSFLSSFMMFFFLLLPYGPWSKLLLLGTVFLFIHIVSVFSAFGRIIMHTGAMGKARIFTPEFEEFLVPHSLHQNLLTKAKCNLAHNTSIIRQYRHKQNPINHTMTEEEMHTHLNSSADDQPNIPYRPRADSTVRFADVEYGSTSGSGRNFSQLTLDRLPPTPSSVASGSSEKNRGGPQFSQPPIPAGLPPLPTPTNNKAIAIRNVSSSSLEQWLQTPSPREDESLRSKPSFDDQGGKRSGDLSMPLPPPPPTTSLTTPKSTDLTQRSFDASETSFKRNVSPPVSITANPIRNVSGISVDQWLQSSTQFQKEDKGTDLESNQLHQSQTSDTNSKKPSAFASRPKRVARSKSGGAKKAASPDSVSPLSLGKAESSDDSPSSSAPASRPKRVTRGKSGGAKNRGTAITVDTKFDESYTGYDNTPENGETAVQPSPHSSRPNRIIRGKSGGKDTANNPPQVSSNTTIEDLNFDDRHLSEDERFLRDYGDFDDDYQVVEHDYGETTGLLKSGQNTKKYSG